MARTFKKVAVTYTVEGIPGDPIVKHMVKDPGSTAKYYKTILVRQYGGRKVEILSIGPSHKD